MRVGYIGNFEPEHSTENHVAQAIDALGHEVLTFQEHHVQMWEKLAAGAPDVDVLLWTRTGWDWSGLGSSVHDMHTLQHSMLQRAAAAGIPTVGFHLDRWWGLSRQHEITREPFFRCSIMFTADGGHPAEWVTANVNHVWLPPGVSAFECEPGTYRADMASDVAFVGSWQGYHAEWTHRQELVDYLPATFGDRMKFWPLPGEHAVRGTPLRDLYASVKVLVGDSCLVGNATHYWSDRIPETLGRGGFLVHPYVEGIEEHFTDGEHLRMWPLGDWNELRRLVEYYIDHDVERDKIAAAGRQHVLENHTYTVRAARILS